MYHFEYSTIAASRAEFRGIVRPYKVLYRETHILLDELAGAHGIKVLMARNYSQNLGEETVKGMTEKCAGIYPSCAPVGYMNADGPNGKRVIVSDPDAAPTITELFERFATGRYSLKALVKAANVEGLKLRGRRLYSSVVHQILRKRLYTGDFDWDGRTYTGSHEPLVTRNVGSVFRSCWMLAPRTGPGK